MKKKILILLCFFSLVALTGGLYLVYAIERNVADFDDIIMMHQIENLREHLLMNIQKVETDLYMLDAGQPQSAEAVAGHLNAVNDSIDNCLECHHETNIQERLDDLRHQIRQYDGSVRKILAAFTETRVYHDLIEDTHLIGESLNGKVETMVIATSRKLFHQTEDSLHSAHKMKIVMISVITAGPVLMILFAFTVIRGVSRPVQALLEATRNLKSGALEHRVTGLKDEFGELAIAFNDMADSMKLNMRAIEESEKRYRLLFESAADAIFILESEGERAGKIIQANHAAANMHGYSVEELTTMKIQDLDTPESAALAPLRIGNVLGGEWVKAEMEHRRKDGSVFPVEVSAGPFEVAGHKYILAMDRDITARKQAERQLQRTERIRAAGELATGLAHEIKNPLAGIKVSMEALSEEEYLTPEDREVLNRVIGEIRRIEFLMKGLLNFAHPPKPELAVTDVNAILENVAGLIQKECSRLRDRSRAIHLSRELDEHLPQVHADPMQLQQIFMNLMLNAVDAMPDGGTVTVKTLYHPDSRFLKIELSDTGPGVDAAAMAKIFDPFFTTKAKGTGLGLSITKRLVEEHGGRIRLENNRDGGATFSISLPVRSTERALTT